MLTGKLFILDGVDGSGKSTACDLLRDRLWEKYGGDHVAVTRVPGGTGLGAELRRIVKSPKFSISRMAERMMFAADECQTVDEIVNPALEAGKVVVSSRWIFTDYAYGLARGLSQDEIEKIHAIHAFPKADCMFIFDIPFDEILARKRAQLSSPNAKHDRFETKPGSNCSNIIIDEKYLRKVHEFFEKVATQSPNEPAYIIARRYAHRVERVDTTEKPGQIADRLFEAIVSIYEK